MRQEFDLSVTEERSPVKERRRGSRSRGVASALAAELANALAERDARPRLTRTERPAGSHRNLGVRRFYVLMGLLLVAYLVSLLARSPNQQWLWLDGWAVFGFEAVVSIACIYRGLSRRPGRAAVLLLGFALLSWAIGDFFLSLESVGGATPPTPSVADVFYLLFYPLAYAATMLMLQRGLGRLSRPNWLDGVVAGLGAAALCATFAFHSIVHLTGGDPIATTVNLAYPIGDLLLLILVIGGTVLLGSRASGSWYVLAAGLTVIVAGDTFNLFQSSSLAMRFGQDVATVGADVNALAWPTAILLISMSVWLPPRHLDPLRTERTAGFLLPGVAACAGLVILVVGTVQGISRVALVLAVATLVTVGVRLALSAHSLRLLTEERHRQANTDELTGLGIRRQLAHILEEFFSDDANVLTDPRYLAFLFVDLNHFKEINDSFGHPAGDELLRQLGPRLTAAVGSSGTVTRLGGDELAVVLLDADASEAARVAERVVEAIETPFALHKISATVGASIGIALFPGDAVDGPSLMWSADVAMYRAKLSHKPYIFYDQELDGGENQVQLLDELTSAVHSGGFVLHYQPQLDLNTGKILAVEALIRWPHPQLGLIPPLKFLPLAEDAGLMGPLTAWVLEEAIGQCAKWRRDGRDLSVSVNISTSNLLQNGFVELVEGLLGRFEVPAENLVIEITETTIMEDFERSRNVIRQLRDLGVVVSIDDFGAGFTSLAYLSSLAVGELKLDRTFITGLSAHEGGRDLELVRATINLGHEMGLRVVAEGIEDLGTLDLLNDLGCDLAQGYYISRPTPAEDLAFQNTSSVPVG